MYCTSYCLTLVGATKEDEDKIVQMLKELNVVGYALTEDLMCRDAVKWYDHDEDMLEVSLMFPHVRFDLWGSGDSSEDLWETHYQNGKMQVCMAEIPPYDPDKMEVHPAMMDIVRARILARQAAKSIGLEA